MGFETQDGFALIWPQSWKNKGMRLKSHMEEKPCLRNQKYAVQIGFNLGVRLNAVRATRQFIAWVKHYDPDVIHLHNIYGYYENIDVLNVK